MKQNNQKLTEIIRDSIDEITNITVDFLKDVSKKPLSSKYKFTTEFLLEIINRLTYNLIAIKKISEHNFVLDHPLGIILRSCLLDFITLLYLSSENENDNIIDKEWVENQMRKIYCDQLKNTYTDYKNQFKKQLIDESKLNQFRDLLHEKYPTLTRINNNELEVMYKGCKSTLEMISRMKCNPQTKTFISIYDRWVIYSKYEHYGGLTYNIMRVGDSNEILKLNTISIRSTFIGIIMAFKMLPQMNEEIKIDSKIINKLNNILKTYTDFLNNLQL